MQDQGLHRYPIMVMIITIRKDAPELIYLCFSPRIFRYTLSIARLFENL